MCYIFSKFIPNKQKKKDQYLKDINILMQSSSFGKAWSLLTKTWSGIYKLSETMPL